MSFPTTSIKPIKTATRIPVRRPRRLWLWFMAGFVLVFVGMLLVVRVTAMHPSGQYAVHYSLWQYYADGLPQLFGPSTLGPASGGESALVGAVLFQMMFSMVGGAAAIGVRWGIGRFRSRRAAK